MRKKFSIFLLPRFMFLLSRGLSLLFLSLSFFLSSPFITLFLDVAMIVGHHVTVDMVITYLGLGISDGKSASRIGVSGRSNRPSTRNEKRCSGNFA